MVHLASASRGFSYCLVIVLPQSMAPGGAGAFTVSTTVFVRPSRVLFTRPPTVPARQTPEPAFSCLILNLASHFPSSLLSGVSGFGRSAIPEHARSHMFGILSFRDTCPARPRLDDQAKALLRRTPITLVDLLYGLLGTHLNRPVRVLCHGGQNVQKSLVPE